ncbi:MAG TPA: hypothetical protein VLH08_16830 [Acidobacteriota bacterium]|nr:hypothetical protein [Acidobacteriota bacterium]
MKLFKVLVCSPSGGIQNFVEYQLPASEFSVVAVQPGPEFVEIARREHPDIAVIDCVPHRLDAAQMEIAFLKDIRPDVRIIALSEESSVEDAKIVEQGIFYYMTAPPGRELIQVIVAAARFISERTKGRRNLKN